ncbi:MAG TPA: hypothetical protein VMT59_05895 [Gaiellaceae bacterium]|nr:hypothetical protein [Gaiellaceae bacterium]
MPPTPRTAAYEFIIVGGETDAGGFKIVPDGKGGWKIVPIPPWNPEAVLQFASAVRIVAEAGRLRAPQAQQTILKAATALVGSELAPVLDKGAAGGTLVIAL